MRSTTRSRRAGQSIPATCERTPSAGPRPAWTATSAGTTYIFEGMHPRLRQVPPKSAASTSATRQWAIASLTTMALEPAPMTTRS